MKELSYDAIMQRKNEIMKKSVGIDYGKYTISDIAFDYERMMNEVALDIDTVTKNTT
nr:hypothetical protein [Kosmotoga sp. DU53]